MEGIFGAGLTDSLFEKLMNIKCNGHLIEKLKHMTEIQRNLDAIIIHNSKTDVGCNSNTLTY